MNTPAAAGLGLDQLAELGWEDLGQFKEAGAFPADYPADTRTFYSPRDPGVHQVILWTLLQAKHSIVFNVYGFDDDDAALVVFEAARNPRMYVQGSLDKSQAGGVHERKLLAQGPDLIGTSIAIGHSEKGAISHDKMLLVDGLYLIDGSTNWSTSGESLQDNQLTLSRERPRCAEARAVMDISHDDKLKQMAAAKAKAVPPAA
jgi:phosphatidylserine/phosphatidylglycerophosphate/cardiolipin synthase-like enzyme